LGVSASCRAFVAQASAPKTLYSEMHPSTLTKRPTFYVSTPASKLRCGGQEQVRLDSKSVVSKLMGRVLLLSFVQIACAVGALGLAAFLKVAMPASALTLRSVGRGFIATGPLLILGVALECVRRISKETSAVGRAINSLFDVSGSVVIVTLGTKRRVGIAMVCAALIGISAGLWEEIAFRGLMQANLANWSRLSPTSAVAIAAIIFGSLHAMTPLYFFLATVAGAYFGYLFLATGNLVVPIVAHAVYDFVAIMAMHWMVTAMPHERQQKLLAQAYGR